ncbi:hypothetical protein [Massilia suwonensis]|uniref:Uncharacterized protein n=1 Tax=Massilia suwonensis TaxID=648895 RepID=A0ABW0MUH1_9BURK
MKEGKGNSPKSLQAENKRRLRDLGLPVDLFSEGFWEREAEAKARELRLLAVFEAAWLSGEWDHLSLPFEQIIERWKDEIASPLHFASVGDRPRWIRALTYSASEWRRRENGSYRKSWRESRRKWIAKKREAQGKPPSKWRV